MTIKVAVAGRACKESEVPYSPFDPPGAVLPLPVIEGLGVKVLTYTVPDSWERGGADAELVPWDSSSADQFGSIAHSCDQE